MTAAVRPFDLPVPRGAHPATGLGLVETPSPAIGAIVCASSTFDALGRSVGDTDRPVGVVGRVGFASFIAILVGVFAGFPVALIVGGVLSDAVRADLGGALFLPPILICGVVGFLICFKRFGRGKRGGDCFYAGVEGVERITLAGGEARRLTVRYLDDVSVFRGQSSVSINGTYRYNSEMVRFCGPLGVHVLTVASTYHKDYPPTSHVLFTREVAALAAHRRAERARAAVARGESVTFPVFVADHGGALGPGPRRLELRSDTLEVHDATATPSLKQRFARSGISVRVNQGHLEIVPTSAAEAGVVFERALVGDSDALLILQQQG